VSGISYKLTNCRKLSVHGDLIGRISVSNNAEITLPTQIEGAEVKTAPISCSVIKARGSAQETVTDSFDLSPAKPAVTEILRDEVKITERAIKIIHNKAIIKGMVGVTVLYNSESGIQQVKNDIPFTKVVNVEGLEDDMTVDYTIDVQGWETELNAGENGENRTIDVETMLYFNVVGRVVGGCTSITDAYFPGYNLECERKALSFSSPAQKETEECGVKGTIKLPAAIGEIETVHDIKGCPRIIRTVREDGDIVIEGVVTVSLLFRTDNPDAPTGSYSYDVDFRHILNGEKYTEIPKVSADLKNMSYSVGTGNSIDVRGIAVIYLESVNSCEQSVITDVRLGNEMEKNFPSILISYINEEKSLWEIAKSYNISLSKLMAANDITSEDELKNRRALVIPR
ncbi:MAG: SPOCS domain-containing protein, partial [Clostridia bacterium]